MAAMAGVLPSLADAAANHRALESLLPNIALRSAVAGIDLDPNQAGRSFAVGSGLSRVLTERGGRVLYSFTESTVAPVRIHPDLQWNEPPGRIVFDNYQLRPSHDMTRFRYLLVHSSGEQTTRIAAAAMAPDALPIASAGEWTLFESTHEVVPMDAPDVALPEPHPATLRKRMRQVTHDTLAP